MVLLHAGTGQCIEAVLRQIAHRLRGTPVQLQLTKIPCGVVRDPAIWSAAQAAMAKLGTAAAVDPTRQRPTRVAPRTWLAVPDFGCAAAAANGARKMTDGFERLTGFKADGHAETRGRLEVQGRSLRSLVNGRRFGIGIGIGIDGPKRASLQTFSERVLAVGGWPGRLKVRTSAAMCGRCQTSRKTQARCTRWPRRSTSWRWCRPRTG